MTLANRDQLYNAIALGLKVCHYGWIGGGIVAERRNSSDCDDKDRYTCEKPSEELYGRDAYCTNDKGKTTKLIKQSVFRS
jgi:hypothetical protein